MQNSIEEILGIDPSEQKEVSKQPIEKKYPVLRTISRIMVFFAWLVAVATVIVFSIFLKFDGDLILFAFASLMFGGLVILVLLAYSEIIKVFVDIEENTRRSAEK